MAECKTFPGALDGALIGQVGTMLGQALGLGVPEAAGGLLRAIAQDNSTLVSVYCGAPWPGNCMGLCPNSDLAGPGVRAAFYAQSFLNALLIAISPEDALAACWSAALLTAAVILPAIIQKRSKELTLHHAMLVLNFATISTLAALASAPFCDLWRPLEFPQLPQPAANPDRGEGSAGNCHEETETDRDNDCAGPPVGGRVGFAAGCGAGGVAQEHEGTGTGSGSGRGQTETHSHSAAASALSTPALLGSELQADAASIGESTLVAASPRPRRVSFTASANASSVTVDAQSAVTLSNDTGDAFRRIKWESPGYRARVFLSMAIIIQVSLQWTWAVFLFTSPDYAQESCNADTTVVLFGAPWGVRWLNASAAHYALFPLWLLACMAVTLLYGILLVYSSHARFPLVPRPAARGDDESAYYVVRLAVGTAGWVRRAFAVESTEARRIMAANVGAVMLWAAFVGVSEGQHASNCVFNENSDWSFGQVSSMLLAAVPLWPLAVAIHRERARSEERRKRARRRPKLTLPVTSPPRTPGTLLTPVRTPTTPVGLPPRSRADSAASHGSPPAQGLQLATGAPAGEQLGGISLRVIPPDDDGFVERPWRGRLSAV